MDDWYIAVDASAGLASTLCENTLGGHEKITTTYTLALLGIVLNAALLHTIHLLAQTTRLCGTRATDLGMDLYVPYPCVLKS